jgi:NitT/TauT family transport system substrate-binding protein
MATRAAALALAAGLPLLSTHALAQSDQIIRVGVGPVDAAAPLFYAAKSGIYKKYGLNVEIVKLPNGAAILSSIAGGSTQLGQGSVLALLLAFTKGLPFTAIGNLSTYEADHPDYGLLVPINSPIKAPKDLEGKTLGVVSLQDQNSLATFAWLDAHGVDRSTLKIVEIPASATLAAMEQGRVDFATFYEPFFSAFMATGKVRVLANPYDALGKHYSDALLYGTPQWVNEHRDLVDKFLRATQEAAIYTAAHEREVAPVTAEYTGVDPASLLGAHHGGRGAVLVPADIQPIIDAAAKYKMIPKAFPASDLVCGCALKR